jgi:hypothetical protein
MIFCPLAKVFSEWDAVIWILSGYFSELGEATWILIVLLANCPKFHQRLHLLRVHLGSGELVEGFGCSVASSFSSLTSCPHCHQVMPWEQVRSWRMILCSSEVLWMIRLAQLLWSVMD